jgi:hypothetical protein
MLRSLRCLDIFHNLIHVFLLVSVFCLWLNLLDVRSKLIKSCVWKICGSYFLLLIILKNEYYSEYFFSTSIYFYTKKIISHLIKNLIQLTECTLICLFCFTWKMTVWWCKISLLFIFKVFLCTLSFSKYGLF